MRAIKIPTSKKRTRRRKSDWFGLPVSTQAGKRTLRKRFWSIPFYKNEKGFVKTRHLEKEELEV